MFFHKVLGDGVWTAQYKWGCVGADGATVNNVVNLPAADPAPAINVPAIMNQVGVNTSWKLAQQVVPLLRAA